MGAPQANKERWDEIRASGHPPEDKGVLPILEDVGWGHNIAQSMPTVIKGIKNYGKLSPIEKIEIQSVIAETGMFLKNLADYSNWKHSMLNYNEPPPEKKSAFVDDSNEGSEMTKERRRKRNSMLSED